MNKTATLEHQLKVKQNNKNPFKNKTLNIKLSFVNLCYLSLFGLSNANLQTC